MQPQFLSFDGEILLFSSPSEPFDDILAQFPPPLKERLAPLLLCARGGLVGVEAGEKVDLLEFKGAAGDLFVGEAGLHHRLLRHESSR